MVNGQGKNTDRRKDEEINDDTQDIDYMCQEKKKTRQDWGLRGHCSIP